MYREITVGEDETGADLLGATTGVIRRYTRQLPRHRCKKKTDFGARQRASAKSELPFARHQVGDEDLTRVRLKFRKSSWTQICSPMEHWEVINV